MTIMDLKGKTAVTTGLVGGIIATGSIVLTWMPITFIKATASKPANVSGLDLIMGSVPRALKGPERYILGLG